MDISSLDGGKHVLTELSASLESDTDETRTSLQTSNNNVVYWTTKDRILLVNTTTYDSWYYELTAGAGTSIGRFEPLGDAATCEEDLSNIVAVYPAVAAVVDKPNKTLSFTINENWNATDEGKANLLACNIRSWNNDSPTAFTHNDIKVSYHANGTANSANFKFRQLGTWCTLAFDFTADATVRKESLQSIEITTTTGDVQISGTQQVDLSDPNTPALVAKTSGLTDADKTVKWTFNSPASMLNTFSKSLMLFPGLENKQLKITAETNLRTLVFYAKPTVKFTAGTVLRFPIGFKQNFNTEIQPTDDPTTYALAYTNTEKELYPFYYYGNANCHLITGSNTQCTIDVTRHKASSYYEKNDAEATAAKQATWAKVIWYETAMGAPSINGQGTSAAITGNSFTVTLADASKYGNALVGIYENETSDTPLWSYHIWHPEDDPTDESKLLNYKYTYSGTYQVMPIALGATAKVNIGPTDAANDSNLKTFGLYYQWGRKDPLGRPSSSGYVETKNISNSVMSWMGDNVINVTDLIGDNKPEEYKNTEDDRYMIEYAIKHPTQFIAATATPYNWTYVSNINLWGNPDGNNYPTIGATYKSVFDPCPAGYRVPPKDLWLTFTDTNEGRTAQADSERDEYFNAINSHTEKTQWGYFFCYEIDTEGFCKWQTGETDFYSAGGYRLYSNGTLMQVKSEGRYLNSMPGGGLRFNNDLVNQLNATYQVFGASIRCVKEPNPTNN